MFWPRDFTAVPAFGRKRQDKKTLKFFFLLRQIPSPGAEPSVGLLGGSPPGTPSFPLPACLGAMGFNHWAFPQSLNIIKCSQACHCISSARLCGHPARQPWVPVWDFASPSPFPGAQLCFLIQVSLVTLGGSTLRIVSIWHGAGGSTLGIQGHRSRRDPSGVLDVAVSIPLLCCSSP